MTTNSTRALASLGRLFRSVPAETLKSAIEDIEDFASEGGEAAITRQEALTGPSEGMRGGNASPMIRRHSDLEPQKGRQAEYEALNGILDTIATAMKAQAEAMAALAPKAKSVTAKSAEGELSYLAVVEKSLKKARTEIFKAETEVEAENEDSSTDCIGKAERLVAKAAELLSKAEDDDEDEDRVEKARTDIRKLTKALKPFKDAAIAKAAEVAKAEAEALAKAEADKTAAAVTKAEDKEDDKKEDDKEEMSKSALETTVAALHDQFGLVSKSVAEVMDMVAGLSRNPKQPVFVAKAVETKTETPIDFAERAQEMADAGLIKDTELLKCQSLISRMAVIKGGAAGSLNIDQVKADIAASSSGVREVFASMFTA